MTTIGIIGGKGRMGSALADLLKSQGHTVLIADRGTRLINTQLARQADVVVVSVPIDRTIAVIEAIAPHVKPSSLLMDLTSLKEAPVKSMLTSRAAVIGAHPMCNQTTFGSGQTLIYCPARAGKWLPWFKETFEKKGGFTLVKMTPKAHDEGMSLVQGLVHFLEIALGKTLADLAPDLATLLKLGSPSSQLQFKLAARHLAQEPSLYGNIQIQNPKNRAVQRAYQHALDELSGIVETKDLNAFDRYFKSGQAYFADFGEKALQETDAMIQRMTPMAKPKIMERVAKNAIGSLGPALTFTSMAAEHWRAKRKDPIVYFNSIQEVVQAVAKGTVREGIVPIENRLQGTVRETMDALFEEKVFVVGTFQVPIHHSLAMWPGGDPKEIRTLLSHPQALNQCSRYLKKKYPQAEWMPTASTAAAMEHLHRQRDRTIAAVGHEVAAQHYGLKLLDRNIENDADNFTRFVALRAKPLATVPKNAKTSVIFYFAKNRPGSLFRVFQVFADLNINLSRIESRPAPKKLGEYLFYLDFDESATTANGEKALKALARLVDGLKCLGSY